jgi:prepilin-type processing-associated H-X9-DG protein
VADLELAPGTSVQELKWMGSSGIVLAVCMSYEPNRGTSWHLSSLNAKNGTTRKVASEAETDVPALFASDKATIAVMVRMTDDTSQSVSTFRKLGPELMLSQPVQLNGRFPTVSFEPDGSVFATTVERVANRDRPIRHRSRIDFRAGRALEVDVPEPEPPKTDDAEVALISTSWSLPKAAGGGLAQPIYLEPQPREKDGAKNALVVADGSFAEMAPDGTALLYISQGCAFIREIISVPKETAVAAMEAAARREAVMASKQVALAVIMFSADHEDNAPSASTFLDDVSPYLKDRALTNGFVYTFTGGSLTDVDKPAETELGYIPGPGGRAVAYADGHVKWVPDTDPNGTI